MVKSGNAMPKLLFRLIRRKDLITGCAGTGRTWRYVGGEASMRPILALACVIRRPIGPGGGDDNSLRFSRSIEFLGRNIGEIG
jgi:hypothetical protein